MKLIDILFEDSSPEEIFKRKEHRLTYKLLKTGFIRQSAVYFYWDEYTTKFPKIRYVLPDEYELVRQPKGDYSIEVKKQDVKFFDDNGKKLSLDEDTLNKYLKSIKFDFENCVVTRTNEGINTKINFVETDILNEDSPTKDMNERKSIRLEYKSFRKGTLEINEGGRIIQIMYELPKEGYILNKSKYGNWQIGLKYNQVKFYHSNGELKDLSDMPMTHGFYCEKIAIKFVKETGKNLFFFNY